MSKSQANRKWVCALCAVPLIAVLAIASFVLFLGSHRADKAAAGEPAARARIQANYAALPLAFEQNQGQTDAQVKYMARGDGYTLFLTPNEAVFSLRSRSKAAESSAQRASLHSKNSVQPTAQPETTAVVRMRLAGANLPAQVSASDVLPGKSNYFIGNDPAKWRSGLPNYARVSYHDVYPGVDLAFHGVQRHTEFDFLVAPGADPTPIAFNFSGAQSVTNDQSGNLVVSSAAGNVVLHKPVAYQEINGSRQLVDAKFAMQAENKIGFELGNYDHSRALVIDPTIGYAFSTYLGGNGSDEGYGIAIDSSENAYITGQTTSTNFPVTNSSKLKSAQGNVFVSEIKADGSAFVFSTYVGGTGTDSGNAIAVDASGDVFVAGFTSSSDFPETNNTKLTGAGNAFVLELAPGGATSFSTYLGGTGSDAALGIALATDSSGDVFVVGKTSSTDFPTMPTSNPLQGYLPGSTESGFLTKLNPSGSSLNLAFSTYVGGSTSGIGDAVNAVAVDSADNAYVTGETYNASFHTTTGAFQTSCAVCSSGASSAFVTVVNSAGTNYVYSTFLGPSGTSASGSAVGDGVAVDSTGSAYVVGTTESSQFPTTAGALQTTYGPGASSNAFITKFNPAGSAQVYSTYLGGSGDDAGASIALDSGGDAYVTGQTNSPDGGANPFPTTADATQPQLGGGPTNTAPDAFVSEINPTGSQLIFSTYLGGSSDEDDTGDYGAIAVDSAGANIFVTGNTQSSSAGGGTPFPTVEPASGYPYPGGGSLSGTTNAFLTTYAQEAFSVTATPPSAVNAGSPGTSTVTLTSFYGYSSPVNLSCTVTGTGSPLPACSASSFTTNPVTPTSAGATTILTITTTAPTSGTPQYRKHLYGVLLSLPGLGLVGILISASSAQRRKILCSFLIAIVVVSFTLMPACGSSSNSSGGGGGTCAAVPGAPTGLAGSQTGTSGTTLNWTAPTGLAANCSVSGYTIYQNGTEIGTSSTTSFNVTGLAPSTTYSFTVAASDTAGLGAQSTAASVTTGAPGTPAGNYTVTITATGTDSNATTRIAQVTLTVN